MILPNFFNNMSLLWSFHGEIFPEKWQFSSPKTLFINYVVRGCNCGHIRRDTRSWPPGFFARGRGVGGREQFVQDKIRGLKRFLPGDAGPAAQPERGSPRAKRLGLEHLQAYPARRSRGLQSRAASQNTRVLSRCFSRARPYEAV